MKIAVAQVAPKLGDPDANLSLHLERLAAARRRKADLVVFPELSLTGYMLQDLVPEVAEDPASGARVRRLVAASKGTGLVAGFVEAAPGFAWYNAALCAADGRLLHVHRKVHLPTYGMFDEGRYFAAGNGFRAFDAPWGRTGILICEDFWHLSSAWLLALQGVDLIVVISASPVKGLDGSKSLRSREPWLDLGRVAARQGGCRLVYANRAGYEEGWAFQGGSFACDPSGAVVAEAKLLAEDLLVVEIPDRALRRARLAAPILRGEKPDLVRREVDRILGAAPDPDGEGEAR